MIPLHWFAMQPSVRRIRGCCCLRCCWSDLERRSQWWMGGRHGELNLNIITNLPHHRNRQRVFLLQTKRGQCKDQNKTTGKRKVFARRKSG